MIGKQTAQEIKRILSRWSEDNDIEMEEVAKLVKMLAEVPGNASFRDSMRLLVKLFD